MSISRYFRSSGKTYYLTIIFTIQTALFLFYHLFQSKQDRKILYFFIYILHLQEQLQILILNSIYSNIFNSTTSVILKPIFSYYHRQNNEIDNTNTIQSINYKINFTIQSSSMTYYNSRLANELELSRRIQLQRELQYTQAIQIQRIAQARQLQAKEFKEISRLREEQEFRQFQLRKEAELQQAEGQLVLQRVLRAEKQKEYDVFVQAQRRSRLLRQEELEIQKKVLEDEQRKKSQALAASRRAEFDIKIKLKEEIERENSYVLEEQKTQQKLERELRDIDLEIGSIYDARDERKKQELQELQVLDQSIFKIRQQLRGSKVRQLALEEELLHLSKLIV